VRVIRSGANSVDHTARLTEELATVALLVVVLFHPMCTDTLPSARSSMTADREVEERRYPPPTMAEKCTDALVPTGLPVSR
jgi:hypothetical protein